jgi:hypothetical protein
MENKQEINRHVNLSTNARACNEEKTTGSIKTDASRVYMWRWKILFFLSVTSLDDISKVYESPTITQFLLSTFVHTKGRKTKTNSDSLKTFSQIESERNGNCKSYHFRHAINTFRVMNVNWIFCWIQSDGNHVQSSISETFFLRCSFFSRNGAMDVNRNIPAPREKYYRKIVFNEKLTKLLWRPVSLRLR